MIWIILYAIAVLCLFGFIIGDAHKHQYEYLSGENTGLFLFGSAFLALPVFILAMISTGIVEHFAPKYESTRGQIIAVNDSEKTEGSFFLGVGSIDDEAVYNYYGYDKYGNIARLYTYASDTGIVEDGEAYLEIITPKPANYWLSLGTFNEERYVFHVPEGSVKRDIVFDNE